ncbi:hypothetical protein M0804_011782 [Polistes exclamans]|nr:hypothetical protein M0804_011782 [Polistes exclamans]
MDWVRRQDAKEESTEIPAMLAPEETDECYYEEDTSVDEGMFPFMVAMNTPTRGGVLSRHETELQQASTICTKC